jgi:hypothetical protein
MINNIPINRQRADILNINYRLNLAANPNKAMDNGI